jgi:cysteinyl-tRNA synthetase
MAQLIRSTGAGSGEIDRNVLAALEDDLNTPQAVAALHVLMGEARQGDQRAARALRASCEFLGIDLRGVSLQDIRKRQRGDIDESKIESLIAARKAARSARKFTEADRIRDELKAMGIILKDSKEGTSWEIAR